MNTFGDMPKHVSPYATDEAIKFYYAIDRKFDRAKVNDPMEKDETTKMIKRPKGDYILLPRLDVKGLLFEDSLSKNAQRLLRLLQNTLKYNSTIVVLEADDAHSIYGMAKTHFYKARKELLVADVVRPYYNKRNLYWFNFFRHGFCGNLSEYLRSGEKSNYLAAKFAASCTNVSADEGDDVGGVGDTDQPHEPSL